MAQRPKILAAAPWAPGYFRFNQQTLAPDGFNYVCTVRGGFRSTAFTTELAQGKWQMFGDSNGTTNIIINQTIVSGLLGANVLYPPAETVNSGIVELRQLLPGEAASIEYFRAYTGLGSLTYKVQLGAGGGALADVPGWGTTASPLTASTATRTTNRAPSSAPLVLGPLDIVALVIVAFTSAPVTPYGLNISFKNT